MGSQLQGHFCRSPWGFVRRQQDARSGHRKHGKHCCSNVQPHDNSCASGEAADHTCQSPPSTGTALIIFLLFHSAFQVHSSAETAKIPSGCVVLRIVMASNAIALLQNQCSLTRSRHATAANTSLILRESKFGQALCTTTGDDNRVRAEGHREAFSAAHGHLCLRILRDLGLFL